MGREVPDHLCLQNRLTGRGDDVEIHIETHKIDGEGHLLTANLPPLTAHTLNEPNMPNLVGCGWYWTPCLCEIVT
jgi:hypothetical protein